MKWTPIMDNNTPVKRPTKRRSFSAEFKARILAACEQPNTSVARVALENNLNANLVHKWRRQAKEQTTNPSNPSGFLPIPLAYPAESVSSSAVVILEVQGIKLHWPLEQIDRAIPWLRAWQV
jgi:transposase